MNRELEKDGIKLMVFAMLTNAVNYLFQIVSARTVSVDDYGKLAVILSAMFVLQVPGQSCQLLVAKDISHGQVKLNRDETAAVVSRFMRLSMLIAVFYLVFGLLIAPVFNRLMSIGNMTYTILMFLTVVAAFGQYLVTGVAQGLRRFIIMPLIGLIVALVKVSGVAAGYAFFSLSEHRMAAILVFMLMGTVISVVAGSIMLGWKHKHIGKITVKGVFASPRVQIKEFGATLVLNLCIVIMMYTDVFLVRAHSTGYLSGLYGSSAQFGKILVFTIQAIISVFLPHVSKAKAAGRSTIAVYIRVMVYICVIILAGLIPVLLFPEQIIRVLMGAKYIDAAPFMKYSYIIAVSIVLNLLNMNYLTAISEVRLAVVTYTLGLAVCLLIGGVVASSIPQIVMAVFITAMSVFIVNFVFIVYRARHTKGGV